MKVDSHIVKAFDSYVRDNNMSYEDLANQFGVTKACITKWRKVGNGITEQRWYEIFPILKQYLPKDRIFINDAQKEQYSSATSHQSDYVFEPKYIPLMVHVFTPEQISKYDNTFESVLQFGTRMKVRMVEYHPKHNDMTCIFAVKLSTNEFSPILPEETTLFASSAEVAKEGDLVIALQRNGEKALIGRYHKSGDRFNIASINGSQSVSGSLENAKNIISWAFPVLYYEVVTF